jgi:hypothetical protein
MEASDYNFKPHFWSLVCGDMIQFLLWFTRDDVQTQPHFVQSALLLVAASVQVALTSV